MRDDLNTRNRRSVRARVHLTNDTEFVNKVILDRNASEYPDPYLREINDADLLSNYLTRIKTAITNYTPADTEEKELIDAFHNRESHRVNAQLGRITVPDPVEHGVPEHIVETLDHEGLNTGYGFSRGRDFLWDEFETLYTECSLRDLRVLAAYFTAKKRKEKEDEGDKHDSSVRIVNAIRFVRGDPTVDLEGFLTFLPIESVRKDIFTEDSEKLELEEGVPFDKIKDELTHIANKFSSLKTALALANIGRITNYHHPKLANGVYNSRETNISEAMNEKTGDTHRNVVVHEFFHSFQDIIATRDLAAEGNCVNFDANPSEWEPVVFPEASRHTDTQKRAKRLWFEFRNGDIPELCEYQTKNIDEMFAVAFEALVENPETLQEKQPRVFDFLQQKLS